jgi:hypothetical protein
MPTQSRRHGTRHAGALGLWWKTNSVLGYQAAHRRSWPHAETIELPRNRSSTWTFRQLFKAIVAGWFPASPAQTPKTLADSVANPVPSGRSGGPIPSGPRSFPDPESIGSRLKGLAQWTLRRFSKQSFPGGFAEIIEIPWKSKQKGNGKKKIARSAPSGNEQPGKTQVPNSKSGPCCTQKRSKRWQMGAKIACVVAAAAVPGCGGWWVLGAPLQDQVPARLVSQRAYRLFSAVRLRLISATEARSWRSRKRRRPMHPRRKEAAG